MLYKYYIIIKTHMCSLKIHYTFGLELIFSKERREEKREKSKNPAPSLFGLFSLHLEV